MLGSILGGIGSIIGGIGGLTQSQPKVMSPRKQILSTVKGAQQAGIHPLAALGAAPQYTTVGGGTNKLAGIGEGLSQLGRAFDQTQKQVQQSEIDVNQAQAQLLRTQAHAIGNNAAQQVRGGTTGATNVADPSRSPGLGSTVSGSAASPNNSSNLPSVAVPATIPGFGQQTIVNPDTPIEAETDLWYHVVNGTVGDYAKQIIKRNMDNTYTEAEDRAKTKFMNMPHDQRQRVRAAARKRAMAEGQKKLRALIDAIDKRGDQVIAQGRRKRAKETLRRMLLEQKRLYNRLPR